MKKIVVDLEKWDSKKAIEIGLEGEVNATAVVFDISSWVKWYGKGNVTLIHTDLNNKFPYPCTIETVGNSVKWIIQPEDLTIDPYGKCQLIYSVGEKTVAKSRKFTTHVFRSLGNELSDPPQADKRWIDQVNSASVKAENAANQAEEAVKQVTQLAETSEQKLENKVTDGLDKIQKAEEETIRGVIAEGDRQAQRLDELIPAESVRLDDTIVSFDTAWSSEKIVNALCPTFEISGDIVTCQPVEGSKLNILVQIGLVQEGTGDPSLENVRPIRGWDTIRLTHNEQKISIPLEQTIYGGVLNVNTGMLTITTKHFLLTGEEPFEEYNSPGVGFKRYWWTKSGVAATEDGFIVCNKYKSLKRIVLDEGVCCTGEPTNGIINFIIKESTVPNIDKFNAFMKDQYHAGNPVELVAKIGIPFTVHLTLAEIYSLCGVNTIYADTGDVTVSGYSDPNAIINSLAGRITALEQNAIGG